MLELASHLTHQRREQDPSFLPTGLPSLLAVALRGQVKRELFCGVLSQLGTKCDECPKNSAPKYEHQERFWEHNYFSAKLPHGPLRGV